MLKITITNTAKEERWTLQGRLVVPWVKELKASWKRTHPSAQGQMLRRETTEIQEARK